MESHQTPGNVTDAGPRPITWESLERPVSGPSIALAVYTVYSFRWEFQNQIKHKQDV